MQHTTHNTIQDTHERGFVILFTILICSIVLALALGIFNVAYKELQLTYSAKESQYSFFAADAGADCALFYDLQLQNFTSSTPTTPQCTGNIVDLMTGSNGIFNFHFDSGTQGCADVTVNKDFVDGTTHYTRVISKGYNTTCANRANFDVNRITERVLEVKYVNPS